jgi:hypothetical protein
MRKTIKKVMIVVVVLMASCHVSEKSMSGPEFPHNKRRMRELIKAIGDPIISGVL